MRVTYAPQDPADGDRQEWDITLSRMRVSVAEQIEKAYGGTKDEFDQAVLAGHTRARRVLLWHLMKLEHPRMQLRDVPDFYTDEIEIQLSQVELQKLRDQLGKVAGISEDDRAQMLAAIDAQLAKTAEVETPGKAGSKTSKTATG